MTCLVCVLFLIGNFCGIVVVLCMQFGVFSPCLCYCESLPHCDVCVFCLVDSELYHLCDGGTGEDIYPGWPNEDVLEHHRPCVVGRVGLKLVRSSGPILYRLLVLYLR